MSGSSAKRTRRQMRKALRDQGLDPVAVARTQAAAIEATMARLVKPKPRWLHGKVWMWLHRRLYAIDQAPNIHKMIEDQINGEN